MKIGLPHNFMYIYSPFFWTLLFILCASFTQTEDVATKETPATIQQNLAANHSSEEKAFAATRNATPSPTAASPPAAANVDPILGSESTSQSNDQLKHTPERINEEELPAKNDEEAPASAGEAFAPEFAFAEVASQNAGIPNEISDAGQIVVTLVDSAGADLQQRAEQSVASSQSESPEATTPTKNVTDDAEPAPEPSISSSHAENATETTMEAQLDSETQKETKPLLVDVPKIQTKENLTEEIPSFSEWTQKQLEEAEKKREEVNSSAHHAPNGKAGNNHKVRSKNYASPDCGAKIVAANPEAISPSSVLSPSRDEYKLNTCTSRIWFIVELCEAVQAKKIDLANFELFSSSPKDFSVYVSDRFPSREWSNVGQFTAKDERDVQTFDLHPHLFGKYIKVEMHSHHGSEHFCPISLFRVYGTSEFEVLEKEDQPHAADDDDDDDTLDSEKRPGPKNLFTSATDAVISIVKKAAEVLGNKGNSSGVNDPVEDAKVQQQYTPLISTCTTPSHIVVCDNCSDLLFGKVFELLSCRSRQLQNLLAIKTIRTAIYNTSVCVQFGLDFHQGNRIPDMSTEISTYVKSFFTTPYLGALCNTLAVIENKVVLNVSHQVNVTEHKDPTTIEATENVKLEPPEVVVNEKLLAKHEEAHVDTPPLPEASINEPGSVDSDSLLIKPTKTTSVEDVPEKMATQPPPSIDIRHDEHGHKEEPKEQGHVDDKEVDKEHSIDDEVPPTESTENLELDHWPDLDNTIQTNSATPAPPKESVFLRLSNRIKTLERNMSLSSQYLEELSRRYKKQVEEMQRLLEKTITTLNEESKRKDERNDRLEAKLNQLTEIVEALVAERDSSFNPFHWLVLIVVSTVGIFTFCRRNEYKRFATVATVAEVQRRKSIDVVSHHAPAKKERRPSEEALKITGTYEHLLVDYADMQRRGAKDRKRKRKKGVIQRSNSITTLSEEHHAKLWEREFSPAAVSTPAWNRQELAPAQVPPNWHSGSIDAAPIVLEESDNNPLQDMPLPKPLQERVVLGNGHAVLPPIRKVSSPAFLKAVETRKVRNGYLEIVDKGHKKSASVDETKRQASPTPSAGNVSLNLDDNIKQKKEKKGAFKKIFRKVF